MIRSNTELGFIHRVQLYAARQIAFDLCRLCVPKTAKKQPGPMSKAVIHSRLWLCHMVLR